jgi:hypothetical protein
MITIIDKTIKPNKMNAGNDSKAICRVSNVHRSLSPEPMLSPHNLLRATP